MFSSSIIRLRKARGGALLDGEPVSKKNGGRHPNKGPHHRSRPGSRIRSLLSPFAFPTNLQKRHIKWVALFFLLLSTIIFYSTRPDAEWDAIKDWHGHISDCERSDPALYVPCQMNQAKKRFDALLKRQSRTVIDALHSYRNRYGREPPEGFEDWVEYALTHDSLLIDDYDQVEASIAPLRGLSARQLHDRMASAKAGAPGEMLGYVNVSEGVVSVTGPEVGSMSAPALTKLLQPIAEHLPDLVVLFNWYAEPRVLGDDPKAPVLEENKVESDREESSTVSLQDSLEDYEEEVQQFEHASEADEIREDSQDSSPDGEEEEESSTLPFDESHVAFRDISHLPTWDDVLEACPAQNIADASLAPGRPSIDLCKGSLASRKRSLHDVHGFFTGPDAFRPTNTLVPMLSRAKVSTMRDLLIPNPCYAHEPWKYDDTLADSTPFHAKKRSVYWRGTSTGQWMNWSNWKGGHRLRFIMRGKQLNAFAKNIQAGKEVEDKEGILHDHGDFAYDALRRLSPNTFNVDFTRYRGCTEGSGVCEALEEMYPIIPLEPPVEAYNHQFLADIDGQSMSCRFYHHLASNSVVLKQTIWAEWHDERVIPWLHYIPFSLTMTELPALLDHLINTRDGQRQAHAISQQGKAWTNLALRKDDVAVYYYRLLLEYAAFFNDEGDG